MEGKVALAARKSRRDTSKIKPEAVVGVTQIRWLEF
jgi:hypothetical protein